MDLGSLTSSMSLWDIVGGLAFSGIGFVALMHGKKHGRFQPMAIGAVLMIYPYFVSGAAMMYGVGLALSASLYFSRE